MDTSQSGQIYTCTSWKNKNKKTSKSRNIAYVSFPPWHGKLPWMIQNEKKKKLFPPIIQPTCEKEQELVNQAHHIQCE